MPVRRAVDLEPDLPTPVPASSVRPAINAREAFALALGGMDLDASRAAASLYGDDEIVELEAIAGGTHPKQVALAASALHDSKRQAREALARIRAPHPGA